MEELVAELRVQAEFVQDALCLLWSHRWVTVLLKRLSWDPSRQPSAEEPADTNILVRSKGVPIVAEGEILLGFPGVAIP